MTLFSQLHRRIPCHLRRVLNATHKSNAFLSRTTFRNYTAFQNHETKDLPYNPYQEFEDESGDPANQTSASNMEDGDEPFVWSEPDYLWKDKSWPQTTGHEMFEEYWNVSTPPLDEERTQLVLKEVFRRIGYPASLDDIVLPQIKVPIPEDHPDRDALEQMKLALMNNGSLSMDDKNEILVSIIDEIRSAREKPDPKYDLNDLRKYKSGELELADDDIENNDDDEILDFDFDEEGGYRDLDESMYVMHQEGYDDVSSDEIESHSDKEFTEDDPVSSDEEQEITSDKEMITEKDFYYTTSDEDNSDSSSDEDESDVSSDEVYSDSSSDDEED